MSVTQSVRTLLALCTALIFSLPSLAADRLQAPALVQAVPERELLLDVAHAGQALVAVGDRGMIVRSAKLNDGWQQAASGVSSMLTAVSFADAQHGWAVGHDGVVLATTDGGKSWQRQLDGERFNQLQVAQFQQLLDDPATSEKYDPDELALWLDDAMVAAEEGPGMLWLDVLFTSAKRGFVTGAYGSLLTTGDGGQSWQVISHRLPNPDRFHLNALHQDSQGNLWIAGEAGLVLLSTDDGASWQAIESPYYGSLFGVVEHDGEILLLGLRGNLYASGDLGLNWRQIPLDTQKTLTAGASHQGQLVLVGLAGLRLAGNAVDALDQQDPGQRRGWSSLAATEMGWLLVGEQGVAGFDSSAWEVTP